MQMKTATYPLARGFSVTFTFTGIDLHAKWAPKAPHHKIGRKLLPAYREARNKFLAELAPFYGNIMVIDR